MENDALLFLRKFFMTGWFIAALPGLHSNHNIFYNFGGKQEKLIKVGPLVFSRKCMQMMLVVYSDNFHEVNLLATFSGALSQN